MICHHVVTERLRPTMPTAFPASTPVVLPHDQAAYLRRRLLYSLNPLRWARNGARL